MSSHICGMPYEVLELVFGKIEFGGNRKDVWAVLGSCKTLQHALRQHPANIQLEVTWSQTQIAGLKLLDI